MMRLYLNGKWQYLYSKDDPGEGVKKKSFCQLSESESQKLKVLEKKQCDAFRLLTPHWNQVFVSHSLLVSPSVTLKLTNAVSLVRQPCSFSGDLLLSDHSISSDDIPSQFSSASASEVMATPWSVLSACCVLLRTGNAPWCPPQGIVVLVLSCQPLPSSRPAHCCEGHSSRYILQQRFTYLRFNKDPAAFFACRLM